MSQKPARDRASGKARGRGRDRMLAGPRASAPAARSPYGGRGDLLVKTRICLTPAQRRAEREGPRLNTPDAAARFCRHLADADQEVMVVVALSTKGNVLAVFEAAVGGTKNVASSMQHALKVPVILGAHKVLLVHNHPSGDPSPSESDRRYYERAKEAFSLVGPRLLDSVVVADAGYYSFAVGASSGWSRPSAKMAREIYRQAGPQRRDNPGRTLTASLSASVVAARVHAHCLSMASVTSAMAACLEFAGEQSRRHGAEPGEHFDAAVSLLRDSLSGAAKAGDFSDRPSSRASEVTRGLIRWQGVEPRTTWSSAAATKAVRAVGLYLRTGAYPQIITIETFIHSCSMAARGSVGEGSEAAACAAFVRGAGAVPTEAERDDYGSSLARLAAAGQFGMRYCEVSDGVRRRLRAEGVIDTHLDRIVATPRGVNMGMRLARRFRAARG